MIPKLQKLQAESVLYEEQARFWIINLHYRIFNLWVMCDKYKQFSKSMYNIML